MTDINQLPPNAARMPDGSVKFCGVIVRWGQADKPCVLKPGHDGPCEFHKSLTAQSKLAESLPTDLDDLLTLDQKAAFAEWSERNRLRKEAIRTETGVMHVG